MSVDAQPDGRQSAMAQDDQAIQARCTYCRMLRYYVPTGARLTLYTDQRMILNFFCIECREYNAQRIGNVKTAQSIEKAGVPTVVVRVPLEISEHPGPSTPAIQLHELVCMEEASDSLFNEIARRELFR